MKLPLYYIVLFLNYINLFLNLFHFQNSYICSRDINIIKIFNKEFSYEFKKENIYLCNGYLHVFHYF